jgi:hypothetical protein
MKSDGFVQYTVRQVPRALDQALRRKSRREGKSLNTTALEVLATGLQLGKEPIRYDDLDFLVGTWVEDPKFDEAIHAQEQVDEELWR